MFVVAALFSFFFFFKTKLNINHQTQKAIQFINQLQHWCHKSLFFCLIVYKCLTQSLKIELTALRLNNVLKFVYFLPCNFHFVKTIILFELFNYCSFMVESNICRLLKLREWEGVAELSSAWCRKAPNSRAACCSIRLSGGRIIRPKNKLKKTNLTYATLT